MLEATKRFKATVEDPALSPDQTVELPTGGSVTGAYFLDVRGYDPPALAATLPVRMLVLQGERDYQVTMTDFEGWRAALSFRPDVVLKVYPGLNHLFVPAKAPRPPRSTSAPATWTRRS
jgi:dienelactone hydrolase